MSPCERVAVLSKQLVEYEAAKEQVSPSAYRDTIDKGSSRERMRWIEKINETKRELEEAQSECN